MNDQINVLTNSISTKYDIRIFVGETDFDDSRIVIAREPLTILRHRHFRESRLLIFQWGVYYDHFDLIFAAAPNQASLTYFHNITPAHLVESQDRPSLMRGERQIDNLFNCDFILCNSVFSMEDLVNRGVPRERLDVLCPVHFIPATNGVARNKTGPAQLLYVGRFVSHKGARELLRAVATARRQGAPPFYLRMVGTLRYSDKAYMDALRSIIAADGLEGAVTILGELSDRELAAEFAKADALVMPSFHEGFCLPVIEAFSNGCFVIAFDGGNLRYLVRDFGTVVPSGDVVALAAAIADFSNRAAQPFERRRYKTIAGEMPVTDYERAVRNFAAQYTSFDAFREKFDNTVEELLRRRRHQSKARELEVHPDKDESPLSGASTLQERLTRLEKDFADRRKIALWTKNIMGLQRMMSRQPIAIGVRA